jgi:hypothetical protein
MWAWTLTASSLEVTFASRTQLQEIGNIQREAHIDALKEKVVKLIYDNEVQAINRDRSKSKALIVLAVAILLVIVAEVIVFYEIAARGKDHVQEKR